MARGLSPQQRRSDLLHGRCEVVLPLPSKQHIASASKSLRSVECWSCQKTSGSGGVSQLPAKTVELNIEGCLQLTGAHAKGRHEESEPRCVGTHDRVLTTMDMAVLLQKKPSHHQSSTEVSLLAMKEHLAWTAQQIEGCKPADSQYSKCESYRL